MKKFFVPIIVGQTGYLPVEANTEEEAISKAKMTACCMADYQLLDLLTTFTDRYAGSNTNISYVDVSVNDEVYDYESYIQYLKDDFDDSGEIEDLEDFQDWIDTL